MNHRAGRLLFGFVVGLLVATLSYRWITNPEPRMERALQESVVASARVVLVETLAAGELEIVDALNPNRKVGKVYIYRNDDEWELSGYYRRSADDRWHAYLLSLNRSEELLHLKVEDTDPALAIRADSDPRLDTVP